MTRLHACLGVQVIEGAWPRLQPQLPQHKQVESTENRSSAIYKGNMCVNLHIFLKIIGLREENAKNNKRFKTFILLYSLRITVSA